MALVTKEEVNAIRKQFQPYFSDLEMVEEETIEFIRNNWLKKISEEDCLQVMLVILKELCAEANTSTIKSKAEQDKIKDTFTKKINKVKVTTRVFVDHISQIFLESSLGLKTQRKSLTKLKEECNTTAGKYGVIDKLDQVAMGASLLTFDQFEALELWAEFELWLRLTWQIVAKRGLLMRGLELTSLGGDLPTKDELSEYYLMTANEIRGVLAQARLNFEIAKKSRSSSPAMIVQSVATAQTLSDESVNSKESDADSLSADKLVPTIVTDTPAHLSSSVPGTSQGKLEDTVQVSSVTNVIPIGSALQITSDKASSQSTSSSFFGAQSSGLLSSMVYKNTEISDKAVFNKMLTIIEDTGLTAQQETLLKPNVEPIINVINAYLTAKFSTKWVPTAIWKRPHIDLIETEIAIICGFTEKEKSDLRKLSSADKIERQIGRLKLLTVVQLLKLTLNIWLPISKDKNSQTQIDTYAILRDCRGLLQMDIEDKKNHAKTNTNTARTFTRS